MAKRQPIVSVLGHVDHGKSTILDWIRGTKVVSREAGGITQHIGATEVPLETVYELCGEIAGDKRFSIPGLLFIDTPGHHSFTTLRARGGALADLAVLVIDINEGIKPQTSESISILKRYRTPFVIAASKIDLVPGWRSRPGRPFVLNVQEQTAEAQAELERRLYDLIGRLYEKGFGGDRYDKIADFTKTLAVVPVSGKSGEGIPDLLLVLVGLAQRFLDERLTSDEDALTGGEGTVLEVKEEKGLGKTIDVIVYRGRLARGDQVGISSTDPARPIITKVKTLLKPRPLDEIRDPTQRFDSVSEVSAAVGIKISAQGLDDALPGGLIKVIEGSVEETIEAIRKESEVHFELAPEGVAIKADAVGSLEALAFEAREAGIPIGSARIGEVSKKDLVEAETTADPYNRVILAFNVEMTPDAQSVLGVHDVKVISNSVVYRLIEEYKEWREGKRAELENIARLEIVFPGKVRLLPDCVFRTSKPAIVGVRVLAGRIRSGQPLMRADGRPVGRIKSIRSGEESLKEARMGQEVAIAIDDVTVGRQIKTEDILLNDIPEGHARELLRMELSADEAEVLQEVLRIRRREIPFWAM